MTSDGGQGIVADLKRQTDPWGVPLAVVLAVVIVFLAAVRFDVGGLGSWTGAHAPWLTSLPLVGPGATLPVDLRYSVTEGGADPGSGFTVVFSDRLDHTTVSREQIALIGPDSARVPAGIRILPDRKRVRITPEDSLAFGAAYGLYLGDGLRDVEGEPVGRGEVGGVWRTFRTRPPPPDHDPPALAESHPAPGAEDFPPDSALTLTFDEPVGVGTVNETSVRLQREDGEPVALRVLCCSDLRKALVRPGSSLEAGTRYTLKLSSAIRDTAGNGLRPDSLVFRTGSATASRPPQARPSPASRSEPSGPGTFRLDVLPTAARQHVRIVVDGRELGPPPIDGHRVSPGRAHVVEVIGHPPQSPRTIALYRGEHSATPGQTRDVTPEIGAFGTISVAARPTGRVYLDGDFVAETPLAGYPLTAGPHELVVRPPQDRQAEFGTVRRTITVEAWTWNQPVQVELPRAGGQR